MARIAAWVISIALVALACRLPRRMIDVLMWLALGISVAWTVSLFAV